MLHTHFGHGVWPSRSARALLTVAYALCALFVVSSAEASAPMCNELAQTIEAPPPVLIHHGGTIRAGENCAPDHLAKAPPGSPHRADILYDGFTSKLTPNSGVAVATRLRPPRRPVLAASATGQPGFPSAVYRPPRRA